MVLLMASLHSPHQGTQNGVQHDLTASLHSPDQDDQNEVQHHFFVHGTPLVCTLSPFMAPLHLPHQDD